MSNKGPERRFSPRVVDVLAMTALRIGAAVAAARLWEDVLPEAERARLGGDLPSLWCQRGTAGIWNDIGTAFPVVCSSARLSSPYDLSLGAGLLCVCRFFLGRKNRRRSRPAFVRST